MTTDKRVLGKGVAARQPKAALATQKPEKQVSSSVEKTEGQRAIKARNDFYSDGASFMKKCSYASFVCMLAAIGSAFYSASQKENNVYFAAKPNGDVIQLVALDQPNLSDAAVTNWLSRALIDTFDFRYNNVSDRLNSSTARWFTKEGGDQLVLALESGGNIASVKEKQLFVQLTLDTMPIIVDRATETANGQDTYAWKYEVPGMITYITRSKTYVDKVLFKVTVQRQSMISNPDGLGIANIIMSVKR